MRPNDARLLFKKKNWFTHYRHPSVVRHLTHHYRHPSVAFATIAIAFATVACYFLAFESGYI